MQSWILKWTEAQTSWRNSYSAYCGKRTCLHVLEQKPAAVYTSFHLYILSIFSYASEKIKVSWGILSLYIFDMLVSFWESIQTQRKSVNVPPHFPFAQPDEIFGPSGGLKRLEGYMYETKKHLFPETNPQPPRFDNIYVLQVLNATNTMRLYANMFWKTRYNTRNSFLISFDYMFVFKYCDSFRL